jgi:hypothetical protein
MVQRSSTNIVRSGTLMDIGLSALYSEEAVASGMTTDKADMVFASIPWHPHAGVRAAGGPPPPLRPGPWNPAAAGTCQD